MTTAELILNLAVLGFVLYRNFGLHPIDHRRFTIPVVIVAVVGYVFLRQVPTAGHDVVFDLLGAGAGVALGAIAGLLPRIERTATGQLATRAGTAFAALWIAVIGGRIAFSYGATDVFPHQIARWSIAHQVSGTSAFTAMFVLMALAMVTSMIAAIALRSAHAGQTPQTPVPGRTAESPVAIARTAKRRRSLVHNGSSGLEVSAARPGLGPEAPAPSSERWPDRITDVQESSEPRQPVRTAS